MVGSDCEEALGSTFGAKSLIADTLGLDLVLCPCGESLWIQGRCCLAKSLDFISVTVLQRGRGKPRLGRGFLFFSFYFNYGAVWGGGYARGKLFVCRWLWGFGIDRVYMGEISSGKGKSEIRGSSLRQAQGQNDNVKQATAKAKTRAKATVLLGDDHTMRGTGHIEGPGGAKEEEAQWEGICHCNFDHISRSRAAARVAQQSDQCCRRASTLFVYLSRGHRQVICRDDAGISEILHVGLDLGRCCAAVGETGSVCTGGRTADHRIPTAFPSGF